MKKFKSFILLLLITVSVATVVPNNPVFAVTPTSSAGRINVSSNYLNVRSGPSTNNTVIATLAKGSYVTLISKTGAWWYVEYAGNKFGYCSDAYITEIKESFAAYVSTSSSNLNIRDGAGTGFQVIAKLPKDTDLIVLEKVGDWYWILFDGTNTGYCSAAYITPHSKINYPALSLSTQDYKQTDSRWGNIILGKSDKTFARSGCLTCCVAAIETYRKGYTILPHTLSYSLSYTPDGSLYWPTFLSFYNSSGYLSVLYNNLKDGKPVIIGFKNTYGGQHWVVVNGYTGGATLEASKFTIKDPGSSSRVTLQQLIAVYPYFYKIAYY